MATSVKIRNVRNPREKYVFSTSEPKQPTVETDESVERIAKEIAKYLAMQVFQQDENQSEKEC